MSTRKTPTTQSDLISTQSEHKLKTATKKRANPADNQEAVKDGLLSVQHRLWMCANVMDLICQATKDESDLSVWGSANLASREVYQLAVELGGIAEGIEVPQRAGGEA